MTTEVIDMPQDPATRPGCRVRSAASRRLFVDPTDGASKPITDPRHDACAE